MILNQLTEISESVLQAILHLISCGVALYGGAVDIWNHVRILLGVLRWQGFIVVCR